MGGAGCGTSWPRYGNGGCCGERAGAVIALCSHCRVLSLLQAVGGASLLLSGAGCGWVGALGWVFSYRRGKTSERAGVMNWNDKAGCVRRSPLRGWVAVVQVAVYPGAG